MKTKKPKEKEFQFYVVNLPIKGNKNENIELYSEFFRFIYNRKKHIKIGGDKAAIIRTFTESESSNPKMFYGYITSFTEVGSEWFNSEKMEKVKHEIPKHLFANPKESAYIFIPKLHRFILIKGSHGISLAATKKYFEGLQEKMKKYEFDVHVEVAKDAITQIMNAKTVKTLNIEFNYSNADAGGHAFKFVDKEMKDSNTGSLKVSAKSNDDTGINVKNSTILQGSLELAKSYGSAEALIFTEDGSKRVNTDDYPLILKEKGYIEDLKALYTKFYNKLVQHLDK